MIEAEKVRAQLREVKWPGYGTDIVAAGFVPDIAIESDKVVVTFAPQSNVEEKIAAMETAIRAQIAALDAAVPVQIKRVLPPRLLVLREGDTPAGPPGSLAAARGEAELPIPPREALPPDEPEPVWRGGRPGGGQNVKSFTYDGALPVLQWEIDPHRPGWEADEAHIVLDGWEYRMWWQHHPADLAYVSIQAIQDDTLRRHESAVRSHPVGRAIVVNVVYDRRRQAVVAIYGTARDFRPFVEAFRQGYVLSTQSEQEEKE